MKLKNFDSTIKFNNDGQEQPLLKIEQNLCVFSAYFIDTFIVLMGFWLSYVAFVQYAWWSFSLSVIVLLATLGLGKSLFLKNILLYKDRIVLKWYFFKNKTIFIERLKGIRNITAIWACWKFTLLERQPFDYKSLWIIINESIIGRKEYLKLRTEIKKLIEEKL